MRSLFGELLARTAANEARDRHHDECWHPHPEELVAHHGQKPFRTARPRPDLAERMPDKLVTCPGEGRPEGDATADG